MKSIEFMYNMTLQTKINKNTISFEIPKEDNAYLLESQWCAALTYLNLSYEDFTLILTSMLLENKILFVSKH